MERVPYRPDVAPEEKRMDLFKSHNRIQPLDPQHTTGKTRRLLGHVRTKLGLVPNLFRVLANAPVALEGYVNFSAALANGTFDERLREQIAITVAESNLCDYCSRAHTYLAKKLGLSQSEIADALRATAVAPRSDAILKLARSIVVQRGELSDSDLQRARAGGVTDGEIVEILANVALNILANYLSHIARIVIDSPEPKDLDR
jgi:uncharacterized peroxidase-related enzyme